MKISKCLRCTALAVSFVFSFSSIVNSTPSISVPTSETSIAMAYQKAKVLAGAEYARDLNAVTYTDFVKSLNDIVSSSSNPLDTANLIMKSLDEYGSRLSFVETSDLSPEKKAAIFDADFGNTLYLNPLTNLFYGKKTNDFFPLRTVSGTVFKLSDIDVDAEQFHAMQDRFPHFVNDKDSQFFFDLARWSNIRIQLEADMTVEPLYWMLLNAPNELKVDIAKSIFKLEGTKSLNVLSQAMERTVFWKNSANWRERADYIRYISSIATKDCEPYFKRMAAVFRKKTLDRFNRRSSRDLINFYLAALYESERALALINLPYEYRNKKIVKFQLRSSNADGSVSVLYLNEAQSKEEFYANILKFLKKHPDCTVKAINDVSKRKDVTPLSTMKLKGDIVDAIRKFNVSLKLGEVRFASSVKAQNLLYAHNGSAMLNEDGTITISAFLNDSPLQVVNLYEHEKHEKGLQAYSFMFESDYLSVLRAASNDHELIDTFYAQCAPDTVPFYKRWSVREPEMFFNHLVATGYQLSMMFEYKDNYSLSSESQDFLYRFSDFRKQNSSFFNDYERAIDKDVVFLQVQAQGIEYNETGGGDYHDVDDREISEVLFGKNGGLLQTDPMRAYVIDKARADFSFADRSTKLLKDGDSFAIVIDRSRDILKEYEDDDFYSSIKNLHMAFQVAYNLILHMKSIDTAKRIKLINILGVNNPEWKLCGYKGTFYDYIRNVLLDNKVYEIEALFETDPMTAMLELSTPELKVRFRHRVKDQLITKNDEIFDLAYDLYTDNASKDDLCNAQALKVLRKYILNSQCSQDDIAELRTKIGDRSLDKYRRDLENMLYLFLTDSDESNAINVVILSNKLFGQELNVSYMFYVEPSRPVGLSLLLIESVLEGRGSYVQYSRTLDVQDLVFKLLNRENLSDTDRSKMVLFCRKYFAHFEEPLIYLLKSGSMKEKNFALDVLSGVVYRRGTRDALYVLSDDDVYKYDYAFAKKVYDVLRWNLFNRKIDLYNLGDSILRYGSRKEIAGYLKEMGNYAVVQLFEAINGPSLNNINLRYDLERMIGHNFNYDAKEIDQKKIQLPEIPAEWRAPVSNADRLSREDILNSNNGTFVSLLNEEASLYGTVSFDVLHSAISGIADLDYFEIPRKIIALKKAFPALLSKSPNNIVGHLLRDQKNNQHIDIGSHRSVAWFKALVFSYYIEDLIWKGEELDEISVCALFILDAIDCIRCAPAGAYDLSEIRSLLDDVASSSRSSAEFKRKDDLKKVFSIAVKNSVDFMFSDYTEKTDQRPLHAIVKEKSIDILLDIVHDRDDFVEIAQEIKKVLKKKNKKTRLFERLDNIIKNNRKDNAPIYVKTYDLTSEELKQTETAILNSINELNRDVLKDQIDFDVVSICESNSQISNAASNIEGKISVTHAVGFNDLLSKVILVHEKAHDVTRNRGLTHEASEIVSAAVAFDYLEVEAAKSGDSRKVINDLWWFVKNDERFDGNENVKYMANIMSVLANKGGYGRNARIAALIHNRIGTNSEINDLVSMVSEVSEKLFQKGDLDAEVRRIAEFVINDEIKMVKDANKVAVNTSKIVLINGNESLDAEFCKAVLRNGGDLWFYTGENVYSYSSPDSKEKCGSLTEAYNIIYSSEKEITVIGESKSELIDAGINNENTVLMSLSDADAKLREKKATGFNLYEYALSYIFSFEQSEFKSDNTKLCGINRAFLYKEGVVEMNYGFLIKLGGNVKATVQKLISGIKKGIKSSIARRRVEQSA